MESRAESGVIGGRVPACVPERIHTGWVKKLENGKIQRGCSEWKRWEEEEIEKRKKLGREGKWARNGRWARDAKWAGAKVGENEMK